MNRAIMFNGPRRSEITGGDGLSVYQLMTLTFFVRDRPHEEVEIHQPSWR